MIDFSQFLVDYYHGLEDRLCAQGLINTCSGTQTSTPTVTGTLDEVDPEGSVVITVTDYDSDNFYWTAASGTATASGSNSYIWTAPSIAGEYDFSVYTVTTNEILSDAGTWSIEVVSGAEWASYLDNTHWSPSTGSWDGAKWNSGAGNTIDLTAIGSWATDFRPTQFSGYISGMGSALTIYAGATVLYTNAMYNGTTVDLAAFGVSDITRILVVDSMFSMYMSSLQFYG